MYVPYIILVSACLMGECVRYDGKSILLKNDVLLQWKQKGRIVTCCPEVAGGLTVPRPCSELLGGDGNAVLMGNARVMNTDGLNVTKNFLAGAQHALLLVHSNKIKYAILKDGSPSCGSTYIYDGSFSKTKKRGKGVTAALLEKNGVRIFNETFLLLEMISAFFPDCKTT